MTVPKSAEELELTRALHQQRATVEILKIISSSRSDARPVFEQIVRSAVALCRGLNGVVYRYDGTMIHVMAHHNFTVEAIEGLCECRLHPERTFKVRLSGKFVLEGIMSQVRRRQFLIAAAKALGLTIPKSVLLRADEVIQ